MEDFIELGIEVLLGLIGIALEKIGPVNEFPKPIKCLLFSILGLIYLSGIVLLNIVGIWLIKSNNNIGGIITLVITEILLIISILFIVKLYRKRTES